MLDAGLSTLVEVKFNLSEPAVLGFAISVFLPFRGAAYFPFFDGLEPVLGTYIDDAFFKPSGTFFELPSFSTELESCMESPPPPPLSISFSF